MIKKCLSEDRSQESSDDDTITDLESSAGSYKIKKFEVQDDFFFSEQDTAQDFIDIDNAENIQQTYWDHYFNTEEEFEGDVKFKFKLQKKYPHSKKFGSDMNVCFASEKITSARQDGFPPSKVNSFKNLLRSVSSVFSLRE